jgi:hypothetical protein
VNKKVVLSVLATAVVASMAASAFAAPKTGLYIGGNVKKFYSNNTLLNMTKDARATYKNELKTAGFQNLVYVNVKGQGATIKEMIDLGTKVAMADPLKQSDFLDSYAVVQNDGTVNGTEVPKVDPVPTGDLKVDSVTAINAKKIQVKFTNEVNATDAITPAKYSAVGVDLTSAAYELLEDNKTVVITLANTKEVPNSTTFVFNVDEIQSKADANVKTAKFTTTINFNDVAKPSITDVAYPQSGVAVVNFTEELKDKGTVKVFADGAEVQTVTSALTTDSKGIELTGLVANKEYNVVILGAKDWSDNLITPNPAEVKVKSTVVDTVVPEVSSVKAIGLSKLEVKFSEPLKNQAAPLAPANYLVLTGVGAGVQTYDSKTNTVTVTFNAPETPGVKAVTVKSYKDLAGNDGKDFVQNVVFGEIVPTVTKTEVVKENADTFVKLTFNTDVVAAPPAGNITGTVTTPQNVVKTVSIPVSALTVDGTDHKIVKIKVTGQEAGKFDLTVPKAAFTPALSDDLKVAFELTATVDSSVPAVAKVSGNDQVTITNKTVTVVYTNDMGQSALDVNNYTVSGKKVFKSAIFKEDEKTVELTLNDADIKYDGNYELEISTNVKGKNGVALAKTYTYTGSFKENVAPTIAQAQFNGANKIVVTFSENVVSAADVAGIEVLVDGTKATLGTIAQVTTPGATTVEITPAAGDFVTPDKFESAVVVLNVKETNNLTDANTNALKATSVTVKK